MLTDQFDIVGHSVHNKIFHKWLRFLHSKKDKSSQAKSLIRKFIPLGFTLLLLYPIVVPYGLSFAYDGVETLLNPVNIGMAQLRMAAVEGNNTIKINTVFHVNDRTTTGLNMFLNEGYVFFFIFESNNKMYCCVRIFSNIFSKIPKNSSF